jgi:U3 small nucleolar RNA-associated protein 16
MTSKKATRNSAKKPKKVAEVIELSSDSEPDVPAVVTQVPEAARAPSDVQYTEEDYQDIPLLRVQPIKYSSTQQPVVKKGSPADEKTPAKLPMRVKDTGSARHRHVSIEIPLMTSSLLASHKHGRGSAEEEGGNEEVFKTPMERRHITFDDSDHEEFVTPLEAPAKNPLELTSPKPAEHDAGAQQRSKTDTEEDDDDSDDDDSDDDAPPEAISSHAAEASLAKASQAAVRSAEQ